MFLLLVVLLDRPCSNVQCKAAGYPLYSHLSPSLPLPRVTVCHQVPNALYNVSAVRIHLDSFFNPAYFWTSYFAVTLQKNLTAVQLMRTLHLPPSVGFSATKCFNFHYWTLLLVRMFRLLPAVGNLQCLWPLEVFVSLRHQHALGQEQFDFLSI